MDRLKTGNVYKNEMWSWILLIFAVWLIGISWVFWASAVTIYSIWFIYKQFYKVEWLAANGVVYITGCDSGFGKAAAFELANLGYTVCAGCLRPAQCEDLKSHPNIRVLDLDVTDEQKVAQCAREVEQASEHGALWALYNNAGYATAGEVEWVPLDLYKQQMEVNLWGAVRVTKSVLPLLRKAKGRVITVTSGISRPSYPGRSSYSVSKAALEAFMDCLRYEMGKFDIKCITIQPGNFTSSTNVFANMGNQLQELFNNMTSKIRYAYGDYYLENFKKRITESYVSQAAVHKGDMGPVIQNIKHAIMSRNPRIRYKPAQLSWIVWWFLYNMLPESISDDLRMRLLQ